MISKVCLCYYPFDNSYSDTLAYLSFYNRSSFFDFPALFKEAQEVNFKIGNGLNTTIVYRPDKPKLLSDLNYNYVIVGKSATDLYMRYYFVKNITYDISGQYNIELELDVMMTFFDESRLKKTRLSRASIRTSFYNESIKKHTLNGFKHTPIVPSGKYPMYNVERQELIFTHPGKYQQYEQWLNENCDSFEVIFCKPNEYPINDRVQSGTVPGIATYSNGVTLVEQPFTVIVMPRLKRNKSLVIYDGRNSREVNYGFLNAVITSANIYARVITRYFPINLSNDINITGINATENICTINVREGSYTPTFFVAYNQSSGTPYGGVIAMAYNDIDYTAEGYLSPAFDIGSWQYMVTADSDNNLQINTDCREFAITDGFSKMSYKPAYLALSYITDKGVYSKPFIPRAKIAVTVASVKTKAWLESGDNFPGDEYYTKNFSELTNAFCGTATTLVNIAQSQIDVYLANNKNFDGLMATQAIGATFGSNMGTFNGAVNGKRATGGSMGLNLNPMGGMLSLVNSALTYDNINSAPDNIIRASNSTEYVMATTNNAIYLEINESPSSIRNALTNDVFNNGYYVDMWIDKGLNLDILEGEYNGWNAIKGEVGYVDIFAPNYVKNKIKQIISNGIRFWSNYEQI